MGIDAKKMEKVGLLNIWDSFTPTVEYAEKVRKAARGKSNRWTSTSSNPWDVAQSAVRWKKAAKAGYSAEDKRWLHLDDNAAIFLQYNGEKEFIDSWRIGALPYGIRARETPHFLGFVKGIASDTFYTKFEALCDGIIDVKSESEGGQIAHYIRIRMIRGKVCDTRWHRMQLLDNGEVVLERGAPPHGPGRLAAIMYTDLAGYTALAQKDDAESLRVLEAHRRTLRTAFSKHKGREVKTLGDGVLVEFSSALDATKCAFEIQERIHELNRTRAVKDRIRLRVGIHLGDVIESGADILGDAVNVASRIEPLAPEGGISISRQVYDQVRNKFELPMKSVGKKRLKHVKVPVEVYCVVLPWECKPGRAKRSAN
ncbi:MAG: adenylate/guanylate cyclase domain-containing protein [Thermoplasmata archaeon]